MASFSHRLLNQGATLKPPSLCIEEPTSSYAKGVLFLRIVPLNYSTRQLSFLKDLLLKVEMWSCK